MKKIYFLADAHLGSRTITNSREQERRLVYFLDTIKSSAKAIYLLGDMFDFWYEYEHVVPKGYTRFLGKISELTDQGIEVHFFMGNHDIWCRNYLQQECGMILHRNSEVIEICGKNFLLAHGDGLGDPSRKFKFLRSLFHNRFCQMAFSSIHPRWGINWGLNWAKHSRNKHGEPAYLGEHKEHLVLYSKAYLQHNPDIHYFIFGHRHIELNLMLSHSSRLLLLGDWITQCTYAVFDGKSIYLNSFNGQAE